MASASLAATVTGFLYLISAGLFILALRWMSSPETARRAVLAAVAAMVLAVGGTLVDPQIVTYKWIAIAAVARHHRRLSPLAGAAHGGPGADRPVAVLRRPRPRPWSARPRYYAGCADGEMSHFRMAVVAGEVLLGGVTCTGGLMAAGKLAEWITTQARHLQGPERRQLSAAGDRGRPRRLPHLRPDADADLSGHPRRSR